MESQISLPIPAGDWVKRLDAGDARFFGNGAVVPDRLRSNGMVELVLPPHAVLLFTRTTGGGSHAQARTIVPS
jgi:hypothetical protein